MISNNPLSSTGSLPLTRPTVPATPPRMGAKNEPQERFVSSDMAQMLEDMERNGVLVARTTPGQEPAPTSRPEPHGEMAEMLESIQRAEEFYAAGNLTGIQAQAASGQKKNSATPTSLIMLEEPAHPNSGTHAHPNPHTGMMGGHLGLEIGEHALHGASHGASHGATEAAGHGTEALQHATAAKASHGASEVATQASELGSTLAVAAGVGAACSGALGVVMLHTGIQEIKAGLKHKDAEHTLEGVGTTIVGVRSGLAGVSLAGMAAHGSEVLSTLATGAQALLMPLGVIHGVIDVGLGTRDLIQGVRENDSPRKIKGGLNVGMGLCLGAAALGGGIPAIVLAGVFLGGKVAHGIQQKRAGQEHPPQEKVSHAS